MKVGFTIGKFAPLHKGHQYLIEKGIKEMDKFYVVVYETKLIKNTLEERAKWIKDIYPEVEILYAKNPPSKYGLDKESVKLFLNISKREIKKGNCYFAFYRTINMNGKIVSAKQALIDIGIMKAQDIWNHILFLEVKDCIKIDRDRDSTRDMNSEVYIFKKLINKKIVYIKLTLNNRGVICISFHESY